MLKRRSGKAVVFTCMLALLIPTIAQAQGCDLQPVTLEGGEIGDVFQTDKANIDDLPNAKINKFKIYFEPARTTIVSGRSRNVTPIGVSLQLTADDLYSIYHKAISDNVPTTSCPTRYSLHGVRLWPESPTAMEGRFNVEFKLHACVKTKSICSKFEDGWIKTWECWFEADTFLLQKTFDYATHMRASIDEPNNSLSIEAPTELTNAQFEQALTDFLNKMLQAFTQSTLGLSAALIPANLDANLRLDFVTQMKERLPNVRRGPVNLKSAVTEGLKPVSTAIDDETIRQKMNLIVNNLSLVSAGTGFAGKEGALLFDINMKTPDELSPLSYEACWIHKQIATKLKYADSKRNPVSTYTVQPKDTAWSIAEKLYGDGLFHRVILDENSISLKDARAFRPGQDIKVMPFHQLVDEAGNYVQAGDTLWNIAKLRLGAGSRYKELVANNPQIKEPSKIYPIDRLTVPSASESVSAQ